MPYVGQSSNIPPLVFGYFVEHFEFADMFMAVVGLSVAAIPEGFRRC